MSADDPELERLRQSPMARSVQDTLTMAQLDRLAERHAAGILTDEEFGAAKRRLLGLGDPSANG